MSENETPQTELAKEEIKIDPALIEKLSSLKSLQAVDNLLQNSLVPGTAAAELIAARQFIFNLHQPIMSECKTHPDYDRATLSPQDFAAKQKAEEKREEKTKKKAKK